MKKRESTSQNLLSANAGSRRVTIGFDALAELKRLSHGRELTCPACGAPVVLHAGSVRVHHFAHLPGTVCRFPQPEPETPQHLAGKLLIARWLHARLPDAEVIVEAVIAETGQRADVLLVAADAAGVGHRIALEYQCANLTARAWRQRHAAYRGAGIEDLWLLGGSRLHLSHGDDDLRHSDCLEGPDGERSEFMLRTSELERAMLWDGAPLLFLNSLDEDGFQGYLGRFRPDKDTQAVRPTGRWSMRPLLSLNFPWHLLSWPQKAAPDAPASQDGRSAGSPTPASRPGTEHWLWEWLAQRFRVTPDNLDPFFGLPLSGQEGFACGPRVWQAAVYYRFVHGRVGESWWLTAVESWVRGYIPVTGSVDPRRLHKALAEFQEALGSAGMLSLPMGLGRTNARIVADLATLSPRPTQEETMRLTRYRRTLTREAREDYAARMKPAE